MQENDAVAEILAAPLPPVIRLERELLYDYRGESGELLYQVVRREYSDKTKAIYQRRPDGKGGWLSKLEDVRRVPYRLPDLINQKPKCVLVVEGEKHVDKLYELGCNATCNVGGAGNWRAEYSEYLRDCLVCVLPDNDEPGRKHAEEVARLTYGIARQVRIVTLPDLPPKGDILDWLTTGGTADELVRLIREAPPYVPPPDEADMFDAPPVAPVAPRATAAPKPHSGTAKIIDPVADVLARLPSAKQHGKGWIACCPSHNDRTPSLSIRRADDGKVLLHCFAGCTFDAIADALGIKPENLFGDEPHAPEGDIDTWLNAPTDGTVAEIVAPTPSTAPPVESGLELVRMSDVKPEPVEWLWRERIALGKCTLFAGAPGMGKGTVTLDIAAHVTTGTPWADGTPCPQGTVILISDEDTAADTIVPRLMLAKANLAKVVKVEAVKAVDRKGKPVRRGFTLEHLPQLESTLRQNPECRLVIIDPVSQYLAGTDSHNDADIRQLLAPLSTIAARHRAAVLIVTHTNKASKGGAMDRVMGSRAFTGFCRAAWMFVKDKGDPHRRMMLPLKNNIGDDSTGYAYRLNIGTVPTDAGECRVSSIEWENNPITITADDAIGESDTDATALDEAKQFLIDLLSGMGHESKDVYREARQAGISDRTLQRAKSVLGIKPRRTGYGTSGAWLWILPPNLQPKDDGSPFN